MKNYLFLFSVSSLAAVKDLSRPSRDISNAGFGISYNLGPGGYASFSLPSGHSHPPLHVVSPAPVQQAVPIFLSNPLYQTPAPVHTPLAPSNLYQTHFTSPSPSPSLPPLHTFTPSRPDKIPPHLHPALNPSQLKPFKPFNPNTINHPPPVQPVLHHPHHHPPPVQPVLHHPHHHPPPVQPVLHHPHQTPLYSPPLPYTPPVVQYDPFEFQKSENETDSPQRSPDIPQISPLPPPPPPPSLPGGSFPPVNSPPPPVTAFPPVNLQPIPSPVAPPILPIEPDDFPEYDAVPANLGPLIPIRQTLQSSVSHPLLLPRKEDPSQFLFTANRGFGLPTSERIKRKNEKTSRMINSHGGPVLLNTGQPDDCGPGHHEEQVQQLVNTFPTCSSLISTCGLKRNDTTLLRRFGVCLNTNYPATVTINLGRTLSSGHGSVSFSSDGECSQFVHQFFPNCGEYLTSCHQVEQDKKAAGLILGCLFSQYPSLMIPLLGNEEELSTNTI